MDTPDQFESSPASSADEYPLPRFERELDESPPADRKELLARREQLLRAHPEMADALAQYLRDVDAMNNALAESTLPEERTSDDPPQFSPGDRVGYKGDYEIRALLGRGGMAEVYKARQLSVGRIVALKLIRQDHRHRQTYRERFQREAQTVAKLSHPNIVTIYEVQEHAGSPYFTMEYVPGGSLKAKLEASHSHGLPPREAAACLQQVAEAVQYAHERGVLHRDLKPENILVDRDGKPKVSDFGLAKSLESDERLTQTGQQVGTLPYMSPEQISSAVGDVSTRTDVYALGVTLYELLTGELPFRTNGLVELHRDILESEPRFSAVEGTRISLDLRTICLKCLEKQPEHRYARAGELAEDLSCYLAGRPIVPPRMARCNAHGDGGRGTAPWAHSLLR